MATTGNRHAAQKVGTKDKAPWSSWKTRTMHGRCIKFLETFCIPKKGHGAGKPLRVAKFQKEWLEETLAPNVDASVLTVARGQGKSTLGGGVGAWALYDEVAGEHFGGAPSIPIIAVTIKQAVRGVYGSALAFTKGHPELRTRALIYSGNGDQRIVVPGNFDGELFPVASDVDSLQGLDPSVSIVDEVGFVSVDAWDALLLASGKRPRSLALGLGTRSPGNDPNALDHLLTQVEVHGGIDRFVMRDYHADKDCDVRDRAQWRKANPAISSGFLRVSALETALKLTPEAGFRTYRLNQKTDSQSGWLGADGPTVWHGLRDRYSMVASAPTWAGVDVSLHHDSTAVVHAQERPDGRLHVAARIWTPGPGKPIPFDEVEQHLRELSILYRLQTVAYDPRYFAATAQTLEAEGLPMEEVPQSHARMVPLIGETYRKIIAGHLTHDADPEFSAHVLNAVPHFGDASGFSLSKKRSGNHIDGCIAMALAVGSSVFTEAEDEYTDAAWKVY